MYIKNNNKIIGLKKMKTDALSPEIKLPLGSISPSKTSSIHCIFLNNLCFI